MVLARGTRQSIAARTERVREDHPRDPHTFKGRMRKAQEDLLLEAHAAGRIKGAVLRLPDFYGPDVDKSFLHGAIVAATRGGVANMIGPLDKPLIMDDSALQGLIGPIAKTSYPEGIRQTLTAARPTSGAAAP